MKATFSFSVCIFLLVSTFYSCNKDIQDSCENITCNTQESCFDAKCYVSLQDTFFGLADIEFTDTSFYNFPMYLFMNNDSTPNIYSYTLHMDIDSALDIHLVRQTTLYNDSMYIDDMIGGTYLYGNIVFDNNFTTVNGDLQTDNAFFMTGELSFTASR